MYSISLYTIYITNWIHTIYIILLAYFSQGEESVQCVVKFYAAPLEG